MTKISDVLMMDGGWGFSVSRHESGRAALWIAYATEDEAMAARQAIAKALENAIDLLIP